MILTGELAQQIVDNIMPIVHQNVNIMNSAGIIIGSGQKHRINSFHKGAKDVIDNGKVVEIHPEDMDRYPGSLPGLNWPIVVGGQIIGVVGVSGPPDIVRSTAELVKMVTELILEREILMEEIHSQSHLHEQFVMSLLSEQAVGSHAKIASTANLLKFDLTLPRLVAVTNVRPILDSALHQYGPNPLVSTRTRENLLQLIDASELITTGDLVAFLENKLVVLKHFPPDTPANLISEWGLCFVRLINTDNPETPLQLGIGSLANSPLELHASYAEALFTLKSQYSYDNIASIYDFDIMTAYLIHDPRAVESCSAYKTLKEKLTRKFDFKYDMRNTLARLLENNLNISVTAKALFIHRNTLIFRLEKLKQLTGLSPGQYINHAILCKILCKE